MNAIALVKRGGPRGAFEIRESADPIPGRGKVSIAVESSGVNFADVLARKGLYRDAPPLPCILGYDIAGRIHSTGPGVDGVQPGTSVLAMTRFGGYASRVVVPAEDVARFPDALDPAAATALGTQYCAAWFGAMEMVRLHQGDRVVIHAAAGGVGTALVQIAKHCGCVVFGTTGSPAKLAYLDSIGVDYPICSAGGNWTSTFLRVTRGRGPDVIFDSIGGANVRVGLRLLAAGGRIVCFGASGMCGPGPQWLRVVRTLSSFGVQHAVPLLINSKGIIGVNLLRVADERPDVLRRCLRSVADLAARGELRPVVGRVFPYREVIAAHELMESRASIGKIALQW